MPHRSNSFLFAATAILITPLSASKLAAATPDFGSEVRPLLSDHCFACHGPDEADREADLRLDTAEGLEYAVVPGDVESSELILRLESEDPDEVMPPPRFHKPLSKKEKAILRQWVAGGAEFQQHWAFVAPQRPVATTSPSDDKQMIDRLIESRLTRAGLTPNGPADRRTLLRRVCLDLTGLPPSREHLELILADDSPDAYEKLVDRLLATPAYGQHMGRYWLDLVRYGDTHGLHLDNYREMWPYRDWVIDAFNENMPMDEFIIAQLAGDLIPDATKDKLIASGFNRLNVTTNEGGSIYDEVFARNVMDRTDAFGTVFLGMTTGCCVCHDHKFDPLTMRDYYSLFAFFNSLDGRAMDQNAKDPAPVLRVPSETEQQELDRNLAALNQVRREIRGPIKSVDAAQRAWERSIIDSETPHLAVITPSKVTSDAGAEMKVREDGSIELVGKPADQDTTTIVAELPRDHAWQTLRLEALTEKPNGRVGASPNGNVVLSEISVETLDDQPSSTDESATDSDRTWTPVPIHQAFASFEQSGDAFHVSFAIDGKEKKNEGWAVGGHEQPGPRTAWFVMPALMGQSAGSKIRIQLKYRSQFKQHQFRRIRLSLSDTSPSAPSSQRIDVGDLHSVGPFPIESPSPGYSRTFASQDRGFDADEVFRHVDRPYQWQHRGDLSQVEINDLPILRDRSTVSVVHQALHSPVRQSIQVLVGSDDGHVVYLNGKQVGILKGPRPLKPLVQQYELPLKKGDNDLYIKVVNHEGPSQLTFALRSLAIDVPPSLVELLRVPAAERSTVNRDSIRKYYREVRCLHPDWLALQDLENGLTKAQEKLNSSIPTTMVWKELDEPREAHLLNRGQYDQPGDVVTRSTPEFLPPMADDLSRDRLGLAQWLVSDDHPLTARVTVNRFWQQVFGTGLVRTSEDFGSQGEPPSHPRLLDSLAIDFRESGWNVKRLMKTLVMSDAYRRSSRVSDKMLEIDPDNRLLARGPRYRLDAEVLRDQALALSGLLVTRQGGPSVKPPQPNGLWYAVGYTRSNTANFTADTGDKVYRRSVYIFWKRTSAPPQMSTFDAPSRESCTARRERTNTPLQALLLMNETQYLEASKHLALRTLNQPRLSSPRQKIEWMFETVTVRLPLAAETKELMLLLGDLQRHYEQDTAAAQQLVGDQSPDVAPWMILASTLLNLDEVVSK